MSRSEILRHRPLRALLVAEVISTTGAQMTWLALPWFVLTTTGSPAQMTLVMIAELAGFAVAGLSAGSFVQRFGARRSMLVADAARAPLMMLVPVLHWSGHLSLTSLVLLALMLGLLGAPYFTAQKVILPELIGEDERVMSQANALFQGAIRLTMLLGPPLGGVLIGLIGAANVLVVERRPTSSRSRSSPCSSRRASPWPRRRTRGGSSPASASWSAIGSFGSGCRSSSPATPRGRRSSPRCPCSRSSGSARTRRSPACSFAAFGAGALIGNFLSFRFLSQRVDGLRLIAMSVPLQAAPLWVLTLDVGPGVMFAALLVSGLGNGVCNPSIHSIFTLRMPPAIRAKAMAAGTTIWGLGMPLGLVIAGPVLSRSARGRC